MPSPSFVTAASWKEGGSYIEADPRIPKETLGQSLRALRVFVRDHRGREVPVAQRSLEAYYGDDVEETGFVVSQSTPGSDEARRRGLEVRYGPSPGKSTVGDHEARVYPLGPAVPADDVDGREPAVVVWFAGEQLFLIASTRFDVEALLRVARSM